MQALLCVGRALPVNEGFEGSGSEHRSNLFPFLSHQQRVILFGRPHTLLDGGEAGSNRAAGLQAVHVTPSVCRAATVDFATHLAGPSSSTPAPHFSRPRLKGVSRLRVSKASSIFELVLSEELSVRICISSGATESRRGLAALWPLELLQYCFA